MLHFFDDKNLLDGEREQLNEILFRERSHEFPFVVSANPAVNTCASISTDHSESNYSEHTQNTSTTGDMSQAQKSISTVPSASAASENGQTSSSSSATTSRSAAYSRSTKNAQGASQLRTNSNFVVGPVLPPPVSPYYIGLSYMSPQYIVPTIRHGIHQPFVYIPQPPPPAVVPIPPPPRPRFVDRHHPGVIYVKKDQETKKSPSKTSENSKIKGENNNSTTEILKNGENQKLTSNGESNVPTVKTEESNVPVVEHVRTKNDGEISTFAVENNCSTKRVENSPEVSFTGNCKTDQISLSEPSNCVSTEVSTSDPTNVTVDVCDKTTKQPSSCDQIELGETSDKKSPLKSDTKTLVSTKEKIVVESEDVKILKPNLKTLVFDEKKVAVDSESLNCDHQASDNCEEKKTQSTSSDQTVASENKSIGGGGDVSSTSTKSWASLFRNSTAAAHAIVISPEGQTAATTKVVEAPLVKNVVKQSVVNSMESSSGGNMIVDLTSADKDSMVLRLVDALKGCALMHRGPAFQLRGLLNTGNWCYVNATLQALMVCPPFVHLLRDLTFMQIRSPSATPMLDALVKFVSEFAEKFSRKNSAQDLDRGVPFAPVYVYDALKAIRRDHTFRGRQEDAEEFLSLILNRIHDEMLHAFAAHEKNQGEIQREHAEDDDDAEWHQVGPNRKSAVTRTSKMPKTPISEIFSGVLRITTQQMGSKETANLESFLTLQLNIQSNDVTSISAALHSMSREVFKSTKNKSEVDTSRSTLFQELPCVLVLHLKCFVYGDEGVKKIVKPIFYGMDLQLEWNLLSPVLQHSKVDKFGRTYKLFAVVFHHGEKAEGGHYTVDVFHGGFWVNIDDAKITVVDDAHVLNFQTSRAPYLLFYRRCDLFSDARNAVY